MSLQKQPKRRSYSSIYKIYRRLRYIRFKKKLIKKRKSELLLVAKQEQLEQLQRIRDFKISEKQQRLAKKKVEKTDSIKLRKELKEEIRLRDKQAKEEWRSLTSEDRKKQEIVKLTEKRERKKLRRQNLKSGIKNFFLSFRSINPKNIRKNIRTFRENAPKRRLFFLTCVNSTILFLLSYLVLFLISQAVTVLAARFYNYPTIVYYYEIFFNISEDSWFHDSVKTIFSAGPVINFVIGITFIIIYSKIKEGTGTFKLFFLWGFLHAVNMLFGALLVGTLFETGVGHVLSWMYIMDTGRVLFSIISIFFLIISGLVVTKPFLFSGNTYHNDINEYNRTSFILAQVLVPYLAGNVVLLLVRQPRFVFYDTFIVLTLIISILPVIATFRSYHELYFEEEEKKPKLAWKALLGLIFMLVIFRGLLSIGLRISG